MARCTAPVRGHRSAAAAADCPACGSRYGGYSSYRGYGGGYRSASAHSYLSYGSSSSRSGSSGGSGGRRTTKPRWSGAGSAVWYTPEQVQSLTPVRENVENLAASQPDLRDVFLCHAWDDRQGSAKELHDLLEARGVRVWFSEKDLGLGVPMMRAIDKGLVNSRVGIVLVTPAMLHRLPAEGIADKELSALLRRERLVPVVHGTTYEELEQVSLLLASRAGLSTAEESMAEVAAKIAELVVTKS
ncbi:toll/interleukin-1 receptor domain-containing protein [Hoeflea sp. EC-HK425]|uniref:toll/interleukin-1 receptor domain-containing protein n=1 Tax=Hoeflea sp. EC-HK425 TaxID=2038388 RepID=UPI001251A1A1|nr:toll/interleukin-1 receptor domain-containing protein [Hoeflea sp. EC-HK425]VVS99463.1 TIR domain-containing protein [Hoeflea sp. EC-HK425]